MGRFVRLRRGASLIEVLIVLVIIGTVMAIAVPRLTRGGQGTLNADLAADMAIWRNALDLYQRQHDGRYPDNADSLASQLTLYTDRQGNVSATPDAEHRFGPYLREIPSLPTPDAPVSNDSGRGATAIGVVRRDSLPCSVVPGGYAWLYDGAGNVYPNSGSLSPTEMTLCATSRR